MSNSSAMKAQIMLVYPNADIQFNIDIAPFQGDSPDESTAGTLNISIKDAEGEKDLTFSEDCSPVLSDFIGGFTRWLGSLGIIASHDGKTITGSFSNLYDAHGFVKASGAICDMIEHRFSLYSNSILT